MPCGSAITVFTCMTARLPRRTLRKMNSDLTVQQRVTRIS